MAHIKLVPQQCQRLESKKDWHPPIFWSGDWEAVLWV